MSLICSSYSSAPRMAFSKIAGLEVMPRRDRPLTIAASSPLSIRRRLIWSSHTLVPAAVRAARRSLTAVSVWLMGSGLLGVAVVSSSPPRGTSS